MKKQNDIVQNWKDAIEREDIVSIEGWLWFQNHTTEKSWRKAHESTWDALCEYIERRRAYKIRELEKKLINGEATATQIKAYDILINIGKEQLSNELQENDPLTLEAVYPNFIEHEIDATEPTT